MTLKAIGAGMAAGLAGVAAMTAAALLLGAARGVMAERGLRGPVGSLLFFTLRLLNDQTLENATGVGSPPWTWPVDEQVIDLTHKAIYAFATGAVADRLIAGPAGAPRPRLPWALRDTGANAASLHSAVAVAD
jgi:hypothetical protein